MADVWFTIHRSNLHQAFARVMGAIEVRNTIPILSHVLLEPTGDSILLRGSNLDLQIDAECEAISIAEPIPFAIPAARFKDILVTLPESAEISFGPGRSKDSITISTGNSRLSVPFLPAHDFPVIPTKAALSWTPISGKPLADAIEKASFALNKNDDRVYLTGYCLHGEKGGDGIVVATTDGLSLAKITAATGGCPALPAVGVTFPHIIVPPRAADSIRKLLEGAVQGASIAATDAILAVRFDGVTITSKLIDGKYPEYDRVIPAPAGATIGVKLDALSSSIRRVCVMIDDASRDALFIRTLDGLVNVDLIGRDGGAAHDAFSGEIDAPEDLEISLNGEQLKKMLASIDSSDIIIHTTADGARIIVRPVGIPGETYLLSTMKPRFSAVGEQAA